MRKILVTGGGGLLGSKIGQMAQADFEIIPTHFRQSLLSNSIRMDITDKQEVFRTVRRIKPEIVIHTAAETNVDKCETEKEWAWKANVEGTSNIAEVCGKLNVKMIYVSTDYVFDGKKSLYTEEDAANPVNYYGLTKLKGEEQLAKNCSDFVITRPSVLYGLHSRKLNFATWVIESLRNGKNIQVVDDHFNSPTLADNLSQALLEAAENDLKGLYHMAGSERISRYEFSVKAAKTFSLDSSLIRPVKMSELKTWVARRPTDSSLSILKAQKTLKTKFLNAKEGLNTMKSNWNGKNDE